MTKENNQKILQVRYDKLFHDLFNKENISTIEWTAMQILECKYEDIKGNVSVIDSRLTRINKDERNKYVDLLIQYKNEKIIIELNQNFDGNYLRNVLFATNTILNNYSMEGFDYKKVSRCILVNLNWYPKTHTKIKRETPGKEVTIWDYPSRKISGYLLKIININLDYYDNLCYDKLDTGDKFYKLLTVSDRDELETIVYDEKLLDRYTSKLIKYSNDKKYVEAIMDETIEKNALMQERYLSGLYDGIEQGIEKKEIEVVLNMHNKKMLIEDISKFTGLDIEEIKNIIKENSNTTNISD